MNEGRKVVVFKWEHVKESGEKPYMEKVVEENGTFLAFGVDYIELGFDAVGNISTAIIELQDGSVINVPVELIAFTPANKPTGE